VNDAATGGDVAAVGDDASGMEAGDDASATTGEAGSDATAGDGAQPEQDGSDAAIDVAGDATGDSPNAVCPNVRGAYSIAVVDGQGCGDLNPSAPQCIRQGALGVCDITFVSRAPSGVPAINGDPALQSNGSFAGGALTEGTVNRTGCTGSWNAPTSTMTVDCGGTGSSQSCVVAMQRVADTCGCPDVTGAYAITVIEGQGCGDLNASAPQCIRQGALGVCSFTFQSQVSGGGIPAINGDPTLATDGSFANGALKEGTVNRTGCTGTWNGATSTMTVDCGGTGSSQACVVALRRTANRCN
jgi:hypothetical protein